MKLPIATLLFFSATAFAQVPQPAEAPEAPPAPHHAQELNLSADQQIAFDAAMEAYRQDQEVLRETLNMQMAEILDADQFAAFESRRPRPPRGPRPRPDVRQ